MIKFYRGTYKEVMSQPTVDMTIYLAWDTHQLFVGNKAGKKTPYGLLPDDIKNIVAENIKDFFNRELDKSIIEIVDAEIRVHNSELLSKIEELREEFDDKLDKLEINPDIKLDGYATEEWVENQNYLKEAILDDYAKRNELFSKDYNDLTNKPEIPSIEGLATEVYVNELVNELAGNINIILATLVEVNNE